MGTEGGGEEHQKFFVLWNWTGVFLRWWGERRSESLAELLNEAELGFSAAPLPTRTVTSVPVLLGSGAVGALLLQRGKRGKS